MRRSLTVALALVLLSSHGALAWDPFENESRDPGPITRPDPAPLVIPEGVYLVTDVYTGDVVTTSGDTTTYGTSTTHEVPGTYARVLDVVGSGAASAFDGSSFNERATLPDGGHVAGTYYEDLVLTASGLVSVNIVFFQDDSATRASSSPPPPAAPRSTPPPPSSSGSPSVLPSAPPAQPEVRGPARTAAPEALTATAAVALAPLGAPLASIDVLRGRVVHLWPLVIVAGTRSPIRTWRLAAGSVDIVARREGTAGEPCDVVWLTLPSAGTAWTLRFDVTSDLAPGRTLSAIITVAVRSPALGE